MTIPDLFFIASVLFVATLCVRIAISAVRRRRETTRRLGRILGCYVALYAVALVSLALAIPRRFYPAGERHCFDDWCVTTIDAKLVDSASAAPCPGDPGSRTWIANMVVSSDAKRVWQRAADAHAEFEDIEGRRYQPCAASLAHGDEPARSLSDGLSPGESFSIYLPFRLPAGQTPAGVVVHHGDIPSIVIAGADQSFLHRPALHRLAVEQR